MPILATIKRRYSVREYTDAPVEEEKLLQVLEAARWAPSACNIQPCIFIVVRDSEGKQSLRPAYNRDWFINAPVIIAVCVDNKSAWRRTDGVGYGPVDATIAMDHLVLAATEIGLGTCWIGAFKAEEVRKALGLPGHIDPVAMTPLGYAKREMAQKQRKSLGEIIRWEHF